MHLYTETAKRAVEEYILRGGVLVPPEPLPPELAMRSGVFVCIKAQGELRGCIGTFLPCEENLFREIVRNAISAAISDPRFFPVEADELEGLEYTVDVLSTPEHVASASDLDPRKFGVIVEKGRRKGLLLPDLEGVDTVEEQLRITKMKAGIASDDQDVELFRFTVERYH
ncbi:MAG: AmmeMemoRadiSam system protein A [Nitrospirales bacterium]|nr:AmmeMemoRadiSam system protein A [Nitrospirales bacterium]